MLQLVEPPKNHQVQLLEHFRAKQKLKDIIKGIVLMPLDHCQAQGINQLSRKPIPMFSQPHSKEYFPNVWPEPHLVQLCDAQILSLDIRETGTSNSIALCHEVAESNEIIFQHLFLQNISTNFPFRHISSTSPFQTFYQLCCTTLHAFKVLNILFLLGS